MMLQAGHAYVRIFSIDLLPRSSLSCQRDLHFWQGHPGLLLNLKEKSGVSSTI